MPDRNTIQAKFLNTNFCLKVIRTVYKTVTADMIGSAEFEEKGWDVIIPGKSRRFSYFRVLCVQHLDDDYPKLLKQYDGPGTILIDDFTAQNVSYEDVRAMFATKGLNVVKVSEL